MKRIALGMLVLVGSMISAEPPHINFKFKDYCDILVKSFQKEEWKEAVDAGEIVYRFNMTSPFSQEMNYYFAKALYETGSVKKMNTYYLKKANKFYTRYLQVETLPRFFEESINAKFDIAKRLEKRKPQTSIEIYTEISTALPRSDMAAECLYRKADTLKYVGDYKESVEQFQNTIRRFPKSHYAPESYIGIAEVYLLQAKNEFPDPDLLHLAQLNIEQFAVAFPSEPRVEQLRSVYVKMREEFAKELYEVGDFYKRTKKYAAAKIYFTSLLEQYPDTSYAQKSTKKLAVVEKKLPKA